MGYVWTKNDKFFSRTNTVEARQADHQFLGILQTCRDSCVAKAGMAPSGITAEEMMLLDVNPPDNIDQFWIRQTEELIAVKVKSIQDALAVDSKKFADIQRSIRDNGIGLKDIVTSHHKLMTDVALLLKTIQKIEHFEFAALNEYLQRYKSFSECLNMTVKVVLSEEMSPEEGRKVVEKIDVVKDETNFVYEELIKISAIARDENLVQVISLV